MRRWVVCAVVTALVLQVLVAGAPEPPAAATAGPAAPVVTPEATARATGQRTEVVAERGESRQVFANPDGTYTLEQTLEPVRVRRGAGWVGVDRTVARRPDGSVAPVATVTPLRFSGGGKAPLAELGSGADRLVLRWPAPLPEPELSGATATYRDVMPDVDLAVTALTQGFEYGLVVKTRRAAADPALAEVALLVDRAGLGVRRGAGAGLAAVARDGREVFRAPDGAVWDTTASGEAGGRRGLAAVAVADGRVTVTPDRAVLTAREAGFPVHITAQWAPLGQFGWTSVYKEFPGQTYWNGANMGDDKRARVGYSNHEWPAVTVRSFFHFDLRGLRDKHVLAAELNLLGGYSSACGNSSFWLGHAGAVDGNTNWNNQPGVGKVQHKHESGFSWGTCGPRWVGWDVTEEVAYSNAREDHVTFRLSGEEGNADAWRKFDTTSYGQHPKLLVNYNRYPWSPVNLTAAPKPGCGAAPPGQPYVTTNTPVLKADAADPDGDRLTAVFRVYRHGTAEFRDFHVGQHESGSQFQVTVPGDMFGSGETLGWFAASYDAHGAWSGWAGPCYLTVDTTAPDRKPVVTSADYPEWTSAGAPGKTGRFTFDAAGLPDAAGFQYRLLGQGWRTVAAVGGKATVDITPVTADGTRLEVAIVDRAGNAGRDDELDPAASNVRKYEIRVNPPTPPTGHWRLDGRNQGADVPDSAGGHPGSFAAGAAGWAIGRDGEAVSLTGGLGSEVSTRNGPAVDATRSFTVSAWVKLRSDPGDQWKTAVSQDGERVSRFALQYAGNVRKWSFSMMSEDGDGPEIHQAVATDARYTPRPGAWTHLAGVHNSTYGTLQLYVDGELAGTASHTGRWTSQPGRTLQIGRGKWAGNLGDNWPGHIDDVKVFDRALPDIRVGAESASEIDELAGRPVNEVATWAFEEGSGTVATDFSGTQTAVALVGGAGWAPGRSGGGLAVDGTGRVTSAAPVVQTTESFTVSAWVKLDGPPTAHQAIVSQEGGTRGSSFTLAVDETGRWYFTAWFLDSVALPNSYTVRSTEVAVPDEWTHVTAVHDATSTELRLHVRGVPVGAVDAPRPPLAATGPLHVGAQRIAGTVRAGLAGTVDEVRVHRGVRTREEIGADNAGPVPSRVRGNAHTRYASPSDQFSFTGPAPSGYFKAGDLGYYAPPGTPGTHRLYACRTGDDGFTSPDPACEGALLVGPLGLVYDEPGPGRLPLHGCTLGNRHFDSLSSDCEGQQVHRLLGYVLPYVTLARHRTVEGAADSRADVGFAPIAYRWERDVIALRSVPATGQVRLNLCQDGVDSYASTDAACGGAQVVKTLGWVWTEQPADTGAVRLYSCVRHTGAVADRFESPDRFCEGQDVAGPLGYGVHPARVTK